MDVTKTDLNAREVYQILKDVALGERTMHRASEQPRNGLNPRVMTVLVDGWEITFQIDGLELECCEQSVSPDKRVGSLETWHRFGTNPVHLLSMWERAQLERFIRDF